MACWYLLLYYSLFVPFWITVLIYRKRTTNQFYCAIVYLIMGSLTIYGVICEMRGNKQSSLRLLVLMTIYRSALRYYDVEGTIGTSSSPQTMDLGRSMFNLGFIHSGLMVYIGCFPPNQMSKIMTWLVVAFIVFGTHAFALKMFKDSYGTDFRQQIGFIFIMALTFVPKVLALSWFFEQN